VRPAPSDLVDATQPLLEQPFPSLGGHLTGDANPGLYSTVVGDAADASTLATVPGRALAYFASADVNTAWSTGVPYSQAAANHWLLTDSSGNLLTNHGYPGNYVGDVGSSGYQQAWIANVESYLSAHPGIDGVLIDDVLHDLLPLAGTEAAKYPTQPQWAAAQLSFVKAVGDALRGKGYYVALNASGYIPGDANSDDGTNTVTWWHQLGPYVNGLMNEYYDGTANGTNQLRATGSAWNQNWDGWQLLVQTAQSMGDDFFGVAYGTTGNTAAMTYGKASFLLDWNGGGGAFMYGVGSAAGPDPGSIAWTTDIGTPAGAKQQVGAGWMRRYTDGVALLNPSATSAQTFQLGGSYTTSSGSTLSSVTLQPTTGMILQARSPAAATATPSFNTASTTPASATSTTTSPPRTSSPGSLSLNSAPSRRTTTPTSTVATKPTSAAQATATPTSTVRPPVAETARPSGKLAVAVGWSAPTLRSQLHGLTRWWRARGGTWPRIKKTGAFKIWRTLGGR
jgi:hypothetical protein